MKKNKVELKHYLAPPMRDYPVGKRIVPAWLQRYQAHAGCRKSADTLG